MSRKIGISVVLCLFFFLTIFGLISNVEAKDKSLLDQIIKRGEIRCSYIPWPPMAIKDPNTGKVSGFFPEVLEKVGKQAGLKIVWVEQADWGTVIEGLKTHRYDMLGTAIWPNTNRALHASFTIPLCFSAVEAFVRTGETRIKRIEDINSPSVTIGTIDGEMADFIARQDFPKAKRTGLPQMSDTAQLYLQLAQKKADVILHDLVAAGNFMNKNPGKIKRLSPGTPLRVFGNAYMLPKGEEEFRDFLNIALQELLNIGYVRSIMKKYEMDKATYPVATSYAQ